MMTMVNRFRWSAGIGVSLLALRLFGQTFEIASKPAAVGETGTVEIGLQSLPGKAPVALQLEIQIPGHDLRVNGAEMIAGDAALAANKAVKCAFVKKEKDHSESFRCIVAGGGKTIHDGTVIVLQYATNALSQPGRYELRVRRAFAVTSDLKREKIKDAVATLTITPRRSARAQIWLQAYSPNKHEELTGARVMAVQ